MASADDTPTTDKKRTIYGLDMSKYPSRMGQLWSKDEISKLLASIQENKSIEAIAVEHERTHNSIISYLRKIAADYYFNDKKTIDEIIKVTHLTKDQIEDAIKRREFKESVRKVVTVDTDKTKSARKSHKSREDVLTMAEVVTLLKDIQKKLDILMEKVA